MSQTSAALLACAALLAGCGGASEAPLSAVLITLDTTNRDALGCYGQTLPLTPHLDRIAREGMLFQNCFCTNALCGPSRATILTGKYSHLNGFLQNGDKRTVSRQVDCPGLAKRAPPTEP